MRLIISYLVLFILPFAVAEKEAVIVEDVFTEYCNPRYDFCVNYPSTILENEIISDNNDGIILQSEDKNFVVTVSGSQNILRKDTWELYNEFVAEPLSKQPLSRVVYVIVRDNYYETSFIKNGRRHIQKLYNFGDKHIILDAEGSPDKYYSLRNIKENIELTIN